MIGRTARIQARESKSPGGGVAGKTQKTRKASSCGLQMHLKRSGTELLLLRKLLESWNICMETLKLQVKGH